MIVTETNDTAEQPETPADNDKPNTPPKFKLADVAGFEALKRAVAQPTEQ